MSRTLILIGLGIVVVGLLWPWLSKLPLGRLPGDLLIRREHITLYIPVTTMVLISAILSLLVWLFHR
ncbi:DUF2905 domain-containing protein [Modicisalibacter tunisiensis]|uniref:DUF2905 domain-containing protein n=1 Tax=Modicisalibacter tunisiensis TaxID=390637 RepID=A0ABS7X1E9_9GAMM|nr:DUF2905 domain-containing protein [Modicisalibacter tunisiensis]MBZ9568722.1 DUF2905 domain-containing protein [Modicisalibacter tunisiensis]